MKKSIIISAGSLLFAAGMFAQQPDPYKVGVIYIQGAIVGTKEGQKAAQELQAKYDPKRKDVQARQAEIQQLQDQLQKGGSLMSQDKRDELAREIDDKKKRLDRDVQDDQQEMQEDQQRALQGLGQKMIAIIDKYAKDNGYSLILDDSNASTPILYASSAIDITQDIIALYDKANPGLGTPTSGTAVAPPTPGQPAARPPATVPTPGTPK